MRYKQGYDKELVKAIMDYHEYHRDSNTRIIRWVCDPNGYALLLCRFDNEQGEPYCGLYMCDYDNFMERWDIQEAYTHEAAREHDMVQWYMSGEDGGFEDDAQNQTED